MYADPKTIENIKKLVEYLHHDESLDFEASDEAENHIYRDVRAVSIWLKQLSIYQCANCGGKTKYRDYCTKYACRKVGGTQSMYNKPRTKSQ
jgi:hypothetical protein